MIASLTTQGALSTVIVGALCVVPLAVLALDMLRRAGRRRTAVDEPEAVAARPAAVAGPAPAPAPAPRPEPRRSRRTPAATAGVRCPECGEHAPQVLWRLARGTGMPVRLVCPHCGTAARSTELAPARAMAS